MRTYTKNPTPLFNEFTRLAKSNNAETVKISRIDHASGSPSQYRLTAQFKTEEDAVNFIMEADETAYNASDEATTKAGEPAQNLANTIYDGNAARVIAPRTVELIADVETYEEV